MSDWFQMAELELSANEHNVNISFDISICSTAMLDVEFALSRFS